MLFAKSITATNGNCLKECIYAERQGKLIKFE